MNENCLSRVGGLCLLCASLSWTASGCGEWSPIPSGMVSAVTLLPESSPFVMESEPYYRSAPIFDQIPGRIGSHAGTMVALEDGKLLTAWYSYTGPHELDGSAIYMSRLDPEEDAWEEPWLHRDTPAGDGNPVLYAEGDRLWLFHAVVTGGWSTAAVDVQTSDDGGESWTPPRRFPGPIGLNVRFAPVRLASGTLLLPAYGDFVHQSFFYASDDGDRWSLRSALRTLPPYEVIQPSVVELDDGVLMAVMRNTGKEWLWVTYSADEGRTWTEPVDIGLANPNSPAALLLLQNGHLLLVFNDSPESRRILSAALSRDGGRSWPHRRVIVEGEGSYSYPSVIQAADGFIHLVYTHDRRHIEHVTFNESWILEGAAVPVALD